MNNKPLKNENMDKAFDACTPFLKFIDMALEEAEENARKLRAIRATIKSELLGENYEGLKKAMDAAGPSIDSQLSEALEKELSDGKGETLTPEGS